MLEEFERAKTRGAPILAEVMGYGMTADAADMVNPSIDGALLPPSEILYALYAIARPELSAIFSPSVSSPLTWNPGTGS